MAALQDTPPVRVNGELVACELYRDGRWYLINEGRWLTDEELSDYAPLTEE